MHSADVSLHVKWRIVGAIFDDVVILVERDLIPEQGVCEEMVLRHAHFIELWSLERLNEGFAQIRHQHESIMNAQKYRNTLEMGDDVVVDIV